VPMIITEDCGNCATIVHTITVASRELRNHTSEVLRRVADGAQVTVTVHGDPPEQISPVHTSKRPFFTKADLVAVLSHRQDDPGLSDELNELAGGTTDDFSGL